MSKKTINKRGKPLDKPFSPPAKNLDRALMDGVKDLTSKEYIVVEEKESTIPEAEKVAFDNSKQINPFDTLKEILKTNDTKEEKDNQLDMKKFSEAYHDVISNLINTPDDKLKKLTDLEKNKIAELSTLDTIANYYDFKSAQSFLGSFFTLLISKERKGRTELLQIGQLLNQLHSMNMITNSPVMAQNPYMMSGMMSGQMMQQGLPVPVQQQRRKRFGIF